MEEVQDRKSLLESRDEMEESLVWEYRAQIRQLGIDHANLVQENINLKIENERLRTRFFTRLANNFERWFETWNVCRLNKKLSDRKLVGLRCQDCFTPKVDARQRTVVSNPNYPLIGYQIVLCNDCARVAQAVYNFQYAVE